MIQCQIGYDPIMSQFPPVPVKRFMIDENCRFCYEPMAFVWFRPDLYDFHMTQLRGKHVYCPMCGRCRCGLKNGDTEPPKQFIEI